MSHFSVVVCLDADDEIIARAHRAEAQGLTGLVRSAVEERIKRVMAPFDGGLDVEPYRDYEDGEPSGFWLYKSLKRTAGEYASGTGILPYDPDAFGSSSSSSKKTPEEQRAEQKSDAATFASLPDPVTWADIARLYNERYSDEEDSLLVDESGRAYTMSTWNKKSTWDYWRIGGRWGGYFPFKPEHRARVIQGGDSWDSPEDKMPGHCDGGPKLALDLTRLRNEKAAEARKKYAEFQTLVEGTPAAMPWSVFRDNISEGNGYTIQQAREEYHSQPRVQRIERTDFQWMDDPIGTFGQPEKQYVAKEMARAVPGYAIVTLDGRWMAPGKMGWFGMSSDDDGDRIGYWETANAYIEALPETAFLIALDCHV